MQCFTYTISMTKRQIEARKRNNYKWKLFGWHIPNMEQTTAKEQFLFSVINKILGELKEIYDEQTKELGFTVHKRYFCGRLIKDTKKAIDWERNEICCCNKHYKEINTQ